MKIAVIGTGYVGLVSGTCFSETGNEVTCVDVDAKKVEKLNAGEVTIYEPGLEKLFLRNQKDARLKFTTNLAEAIEDALLIFLALPTPPDEDGSADLRYVLGVAKELGMLMKEGEYKVIVNKSTVPVGTAEKVNATIQEVAASKNLSLTFDVISNPEFLREGVAVDDFMKPDRVIIGTRSQKAIQVMNDLYAPYVRQGNPILFMDERSAELTKYAANSFLAVKISFMNEIAQVCERVGADVDMVRRGIGSDDRIGKRFLFPGIGYGGSCFPKDVQALHKSADDAGYNFRILDAVMEINDEQKQHLIPKVLKYFNNNIKGRRFALWGLSFKPNTDDIREAPALAIIDRLLEAGATVAAFDPEAMKNTRNQIGEKITFSPTQYETLHNADALIIATEWNEFRTPDFNKISSMLKHKAIFDGRNLFDLAQMESLGFHYESVGRKKISFPENKTSKPETV